MHHYTPPRRARRSLSPSQIFWFNRRAARWPAPASLLERIAARGRRAAPCAAAERGPALCTARPKVVPTFRPLLSPASTAALTLRQSESPATLADWKLGVALLPATLYHPLQSSWATPPHPRQQAKQPPLMRRISMSATICLSL